MATAKSRCSHLKEPRLRRVSAQNPRVTPITEHEGVLGSPYTRYPMKKKLLLVLLGISIVFAVLAICASMQVRATPDERARTLAGDDLIPQPIGSVNHAITIRRPPHDVWPWLAQMGSDRAGWYAYDFIDNGGHRSAERILPDYQNVHVGSVFPALPGAKDVFVVAQCEPEHSLVFPGGSQGSISDHLGVRPRTTATRPNTADRALSPGLCLSSLRPAGIAPPRPHH